MRGPLQYTDEFTGLRAVECELCGGDGLEWDDASDDDKATRACTFCHGRGHYLLSVQRGSPWDEPPFVVEAPSEVNAAGGEC